MAWKDQFEVKLVAVEEAIREIRSDFESASDDFRGIENIQTDHLADLVANLDDANTTLYNAEEEDSDGDGVEDENEEDGDIEGSGEEE